MGQIRKARIASEREREFVVDNAQHSGRITFANVVYNFHRGTKTVDVAAFFCVSIDEEKRSKVA